ncbi:hypothetical protein AAVH_24208 [Aphelenchoides avenae]|nr:hypothetical protein AAVH_24208 [Aphelenchus avenae]
MNHWNTSQTPVVMGTHADQWLFTAWILFWTTACTISMVVVALFEVKIKRHLGAMGSATHDATRKMHKEFHRALLAMAICPLITTSPPILFFMAAAYFRWTPGPMQAFLTMAPSSITTFNPLTTMFFMRSYREVILSVFCKKKRRNAVGTTCVTGLGLEVATTAHSNSAQQNNA